MTTNLTDKEIQALTEAVEQPSMYCPIHQQCFITETCWLCKGDK